MTRENSSSAPDRHDGAEDALMLLANSMRNECDIEDNTSGRVQDAVAPSIGADNELTLTDDVNNLMLSPYADTDPLLAIPLYKDLSAVSIEDIEVPKSKENFPFPVLLGLILATGRYKDSIIWLPHGRAFRIHDREKFLAEVLPQFFSTSSFGRFMAWARAYGFQQMEAVNITLYHEMFIRSHPLLAYKMAPKERARTEAEEGGLAPVVHLPHCDDM